VPPPDHPPSTRSPQPTTPASLHMYPGSCCRRHRTQRYCDMGGGRNRGSLNPDGSWNARFLEPTTDLPQTLFPPSTCLFFPPAPPPGSGFPLSPTDASSLYLTHVLFNLIISLLSGIPCCKCIHGAGWLQGGVRRVPQQQASNPVGHRAPTCNAPGLCCCHGPGTHRRWRHLCIRRFVGLSPSVTCSRPHPVTP